MMISTSSAGPKASELTQTQIETVATEHQGNRVAMARALQVSSTSTPSTSQGTRAQFRMTGCIFVS